MMCHSMFSTVLRKRICAHFVLRLSSSVYIEYSDPLKVYGLGMTVRILFRFDFDILVSTPCALEHFVTRYIFTVRDC
jgi:hypothetical protein